MLPLVVDAVLARVAACPEIPVGRAACRLAEVLRPVMQSAWPEVALAFSRLTNTGVPVEFAWTSRDPSLRWTAEVAPPEVPEGSRVERAFATASMSGAAAPWVALQHGGRLHYGAWVGMRHSEDSDVSKVYVELPSGRLPQDWRRRHLLLAGMHQQWRMAGVGPAGATEFYARVYDMDPALLQSMERSAFGRTGCWIDAIARLLGRSELPRPSGVSLAFNPDGEPCALTWFAAAKALFRDDDATQAALLRQAGDDQGKALLCALSGGTPDGRWRHGMVGVGVDHHESTWVQVGIRP